MAAPKRLYVPVLKWKQGELKALENLHAQDRALMLPMISLLDDTIDFDDPEVKGSSPADKAVGRLWAAWGTGPIFIDAEQLDDGSVKSASHPLQMVFDSARQKGMKAIPVSTLGSSPEYESAVAAIVAIDGRGCALRLGVDELVDPGKLLAGLTQHLSKLGLQPNSVDLILDWGPIDSAAGAQTYLAAAAVIPSIPNLMTWRSVVFLGSAFPSSLAGMGVGLSTTPRAEWIAYTLLSQKPPGGRIVSFGDYAVAYPIYTAAPFLGSASIRYTVTDDWLIVRGRSLRGPVYGGFGQFQALCSQLVATPDFMGAGHSWGCRYIGQCASGQVGSGNLTTWRAVGTNHHLTFVARQLSSHVAPSTALAPPPVGPKD
ncbi:MAG: beta family protein [Deltaproteobacteria bacterium]